MLCENNLKLLFFKIANITCSSFKKFPPEDLVRTNCPLKITKHNSQGIISVKTNKNHHQHCTKLRLPTMIGELAMRAITASGTHHPPENVCLTATCPSADCFSSQPFLPRQVCSPKPPLLGPPILCLAEEMQLLWGWGPEGFDAQRQKELPWKMASKT